MHGCDTKNILAAVGLTEKDLFNNVQEKPHVVAEYIYTDENKKPLYKVMRYEPKNFIQAKYNNGNWVFKMTDVRYVLYNLPKVIESDVVYFVEGEKDADNLNSIGLVATTTVSGASSFNKRAKEYCESLKNKQVFIIPDNDKSGYKYAEDIKKALDGIAKDIKILKLVDIVKELPEKGDISDVLKKYGKEKTLEIIKELQEKKDIDAEQEEELSREIIFSVNTFEKLYKYEVQDLESFYKFYNKLKDFCDKKRITGFDKAYKLYKESVKEKYSYNSNILVFPELNQITYNANKYRMTAEGYIYELKPGEDTEVLVCYHPIIPVEKYENLEDGTIKIKLAYYVADRWKTIIVEKSLISSSQSIIKLADFGISVTSENAKYLVKYLSEMENININKIPVKTSISRLGWFEGVLVPYSKEFEFDNTKDMPYLEEKFGESGKLEDWVDFFLERRKYNNISRIIMAAGVASILLKRLKQSGFTIHVWGQSEYGKTVVCMTGQSIFGNPSQTDNKGIGINFNCTSAGLEYILNAYNNIPLFINEMQHQKDAKDYDKILFLISEGKGKTRSTKNGGLSRENSWNNVVITNGEKDIIKSNSNAGAYNRCLSYEMTDYSYENLSEVADFVKENYGTPIRAILERLDDFDCKAIYKKKLEEVDKIDITNKQKILLAILMTADKLIVDILFKDNFYLTSADFEDKVVKKEEVAIEERAYENIRDWFISEKRHFLSSDDDGEISNQDLKVEIYGRELNYGKVAIISSVLRDTLQDMGYDDKEVINSWKRKGYLNNERGRNTKTIKINNVCTKCIVLDLKKDLSEEDEDDDILPF